MFNTMVYAKKLEAVGLPRAQAEAHVEIIANIIEDDLVTKQDIRELEFRLVTKLSVIMGTMLTMSIAIITVLNKLL